MYLDNKKALINPSFRLGSSKATSTYLLVICIVDVMFLPYIRLLSCSLAMIIVALWHCKYAGRLLKNKSFLILVFLMVVSLGYRLATYGLNFQIVSRAILILYSFLFFLFFSAEIRLEVVKTLLALYIAVALGFAVLYMLSPSQYFSIRTYWTLSSTNIIFMDMMYSRFTFIYSDPNNAGYVFDAILLYLLIFEKSSLIETVFLVGSVSVIVMVTFSVGAFILLLLLLMATIYVKNKDNSFCLTLITMLLLFALVMFILIMQTVNLQTAIRNDFITTLLNRVSINSGNQLGGRLAIWKDTVKNCTSLINVLFGKGSTIDKFGVEYAPHNGFLYLFFSFGFVSVCVFTRQFFTMGKRTRLSNYIPIIPLFAAVFVNTGFSDYRFISMFSLIVACTHINSYTKRCSPLQFRDCLA